MGLNLRLINTVLVFLIGIGIGYLLTAKGSRNSSTSNVPPKQFSVSKNTELMPIDFDASKRQSGKVETGENNVFETDLTGDIKEIIRKKSRKNKKRKFSADKVEMFPVEVSDDEGIEVIEDIREQFFEDPRKFAGKTVSMELQMIVSKKLDNNWRLNLMYYGADKEISYVYIDDIGCKVLGEMPRLRIGYYYLVKFQCREGKISFGNDLISILPTGRKADWATGISAVED